MRCTDCGDRYTEGWFAHYRACPAHRPPVPLHGIGWASMFAVGRRLPDGRVVGPGWTFTPTEEGEDDAG